MTDYPYPVSKLLTLGEPDAATADKWPNYLELGLTDEHIPDLILLATDQGLSWAESETAGIWGPVHAWRALGQLKAAAAAEPLLSLFDDLDEDEYFDEWTVEELPEVYAMLGPATIPALSAYLADPAHGVYPRDAAASSLAAITKTHPEARVECIAHITAALEGFNENDPTLNAYLISSLLHLDAKESLPVIERAFEANRVDDFVVNWADVQRALSLTGYRDDLARESESSPPPRVIEDRTGSRSQAQARAKAKAKRKQAEKSRKKNRKRK